jgi:hypothetical protein
MAEALAVLGAVSAASALAEQSIKIIRFLSDLPTKVRDAPASIQNQVVQVQQLVEIARLIEHNPSLQTSGIASILGTCGREAQQLLDVLWKLSVAAEDGRAKKLWKAIDGMKKEKDILAHLDGLEREKSALTLCISSIDS